MLSLLLSKEFQPDDANFDRDNHANPVGAFFHQKDGLNAFSFDVNRQVDCTNTPRSLKNLPQETVPSVKILN